MGQDCVKQCWQGFLEKKLKIAVVTLIDSMLIHVVIITCHLLVNHSFLQMPRISTNATQLSPDNLIIPGQARQGNSFNMINEAHSLFCF